MSSAHLHLLTSLVGVGLKGSLNKSSLILQNWPSSSSWLAFLSQWLTSQVLSLLNHGVHNHPKPKGWLNGAPQSERGRQTHRNSFRFSLGLFTGTHWHSQLLVWGKFSELISLGWWVITELAPTVFSSAWWLSNLGLSQALCSPAVP